MLHSLNFYLQQAIEEGFQLTPACRESIKENYKLAQQVPVEIFEEDLKKCIYRSTKKLEELLAVVQEAHDQLKEEEMPCEIEMSPTFHVRLSLVRIKNAIKNAVRVKKNAQKDDSASIFILKFVFSSNNKKAE